jgi:hypothetical protein
MMTSRQDSKIGRRDFLRSVGVGATVTAATAAPLSVGARADSEMADDKRRARYQPNSPNVQDYYRVNRYPAK